MAKGRFVYDYPRPALTVDMAVFVLRADVLQILMIRRRQDPFAGRWALPGGFVNEGEPFDVAALRELREETGLDLKAPAEFVGIYGKEGRDPRGWTVSVAHAATTRLPRKAVKGSDDASEAGWIAVSELKGQLAFDHDEILRDALDWLRRGVLEGDAGLRLLPARFDLDAAKALLRAIQTRTKGETWLKRLIQRGRIKHVEGGQTYQQVG